MTISITFLELKDYIKRHFGKIVNLSKVSDHEVCISYTQKILFKTVDVPVNVSIDNVGSSSIWVTYDGGFGIDMIIAGVLVFIKGKYPELNDVLKSEDNRQLCIDLSSMSNLQTLFEKVEMTGVSVREDHFEVRMALL
jgi:intracellular septation protein A